MCYICVYNIRREPYYLGGLALNVPRKDANVSLQSRPKHGRMFKVGLHSVNGGLKRSSEMLDMVMLGFSKQIIIDC